MLAAYTFNSNYRPQDNQQAHLPSLRLLEGGKFTPRQFSPVLIKEYNQVRLRFFQWGLIPAWAKINKTGKPRLFLPAERVLEHPGFQIALQRQRCLIPADGYYIEQAKANGIQTHKVSSKQGETFCFAGIYDSWRKPDGSVLQTFSILTTSASAPLHSFGLQMPMILPRNFEQAWLNPKTQLSKIDMMMKLPMVQPLDVHPVKELKELELPGIIEHVAA